MKQTGEIKTTLLQHLAAILILAVGMLAFDTFEVRAQSAVRHHTHAARPSQPVDSAASILPDSIPVAASAISDRRVVVEEEPFKIVGDSLRFAPSDTVAVLTAGEAWEADSLAWQKRSQAVMDRLDNIPEEEWVPRAVEFSPDPNRAVWLSALFPGLGQIYNRRYWKLPIILGGYLGLGYATSWNNQMLKDYSRAYSDILDNDPSTNSYMDFFAPNVKESDLDKSWLTNLLRSRKNYFRRNRDLCIISMVGVYLLAMVDAYVDASLSHFDISPQLSMDVVPALIPDGNRQHPSLGLCWALNF